LRIGGQRADRGLAGADEQQAIRHVTVRGKAPPLSWIAKVNAMPLRSSTRRGR
jgi:hypothetical protein